MHQSNPGVRRLRVSQPSIHFPRSVYLLSMKLGAIINDLAAKESLFYHAAQEFPRVRRQLVTVMNHSRLNAKFFRGTPDHDVGIAANGNRAFPLLQTNQTS